MTELLIGQFTLNGLVIESSSLNLPIQPGVYESLRTQVIGLR